MVVRKITDPNKIVKANVKKTVSLDDQVFGVLYLNPEFNPGGDTVRETEFCIEQDATGAANYYTVVHAGQLFYLRNICDKEIKIEFKPGMFVNPETKTPITSPIVLPKKAGAVEPVVQVRIKPDAKVDETIYVRAEGAGNGHGSPTLIIRKPPVGES